MLKFFKSVLLFLSVMIIFQCASQPDRPVYINMVYNFTPLSYKGVNFKPLNSPFTRFNVTQRIVGLALRIKAHPDIHASVNISSALLNQLDKNYLERLKPNIHLANEELDVEKFRMQYLEKTDPWIDLLITESSEMNRQQRDFLYNWSGEQPYHCFSVDESVIKKFPDYIELLPDNVIIGKYKGVKSRNDYTFEDRTRLKFLFNLAGFDLLFLQGAVQLPIRNEKYEYAYSKLHRWIKWEKGDPDDPGDDTYHLVGEITEDDCHQLVIEIYKILASVDRSFRNLIYDEKKEQGQLEMMLSPYENPVLALLQDSDAGIDKTEDTPRPSRYFFPEDASWQLRLGMANIKSHFKTVPTGLWLDQGSMVPELLPLIVNEGVRWIPALLSPEIAGKDQNLTEVYQFTDEKQNKVYTFIPHVNLSEKFNNNINKLSSRTTGIQFANEILNSAPSSSPKPVVTLLYNQQEQPDLTVFNLQNWAFLEDFFTAVDSLNNSAQFIPVLPTEVLKGNKKRSINPRARESVIQIQNEQLGENFNNWIGTDLQNVAWEYLGEVRNGFEKLNLQFNPGHPNMWIKHAWEEFYAAQNSIWFLAFGNFPEKSYAIRQNIEDNFRERLFRVYYYLNRAGFDLEPPDVPQLYQPEQRLMVPNPFESDPTINGRQDKIWRSQGAYSSDRDQSGELDYIDFVYWGYDKNNVYGALKSKKISLQQAFKQDSLVVIIYSFSENEKRISLDLKKSHRGILKSSVTYKNEVDVFRFAMDSTHVTARDTSVLAGVQNYFFEFSIPFRQISNKGVSKKLFIQIWKNMELVDYFPNYGFMEINTN